MAIPAKHRERLQQESEGQLIVTVDTDRCLLIYPLPVWLEVEKKLAKLPSTHRRARGLKRLLLGSAEECDMDNQGRNLISAPLRSFARLEKKAVLVGQGEKFELWNEDSWVQLQDELLSQDSDDDLPAEFNELLSF